MRDAAAKDQPMPTLTKPAAKEALRFAKIRVEEADRTAAAARQTFSDAVRDNLTDYSAHAEWHLMRSIQRVSEALTDLEAEASTLAQTRALYWACLLHGQRSKGQPFEVSVRPVLAADAIAAIREALDAADPAWLAARRDEMFSDKPPVEVANPAMAAVWQEVGRTINWAAGRSPSPNAPSRLDEKSSQTALQDDSD